MRRGGYAFFASRRCDIFTADLCNSIMPKTFSERFGRCDRTHSVICPETCGPDLWFLSPHCLLPGTEPAINPSTPPPSPPRGIPRP
jgi:hypothetical protein